MSTRHDCITFARLGRSRKPTKAAFYCLVSAFESCLARNCFLRGFVNGSISTRNLPISMISEFLDMFPLRKQVFVASAACRPKPKASKEKTEEQLVMSPDVRCNSFWCKSVCSLMPCESCIAGSTELPCKCQCFPAFNFQHVF